MRLIAKIHRDDRIVASYTAKSTLETSAQALLDCLEQTYKALDLAEPVWVSKHTRDFSRFRRTKLFPGDFLEPVSFDYVELELLF